jgi:hypothetical protein
MTLNTTNLTRGTLKYKVETMQEYTKQTRNKITMLFIFEKSTNRTSISF